VDLRESSYVKFTSDNPDVATVTGDGLVTTTGFGLAKITVEYNGLSAVVPVTVRNASVGVLPAQTLKITEPKDGTVVYAGQTMTVVVEASPASAFREISIVGEPALGDSPVLTAPPYRFSMRIKPDARPRRYTITAEGLIQPGKAGSSEPVSVQVERSDSPPRLPIASTSPNRFAKRLTPREKWRRRTSKWLRTPRTENRANPGLQESLRESSKKGTLDCALPAPCEVIWASTRGAPTRQLR
jgi:hypothetical protein